MQSEVDYAPIVLFCYNRPDHLAKTIAALRANSLAPQSRLFIFSDGSRNADDADKVKAVRALVDQVDGFREITIYKSPVNKGLAQSVIDGVSDIIDRHGKVIVLEDDIVTTPDFLQCLNDLLLTYKNRPDIFSVSGFAPPIELPTHFKQDFYLAPRTSSWGWATWADRWKLADWGSTFYLQMLVDPELRKRFISGGNDLYPMIVKQQRGLIDSWAVRWCLSQAVHEACSVYPVKSKLVNIGTDGSGANFTFHTHAYDVSLNPEPLRIDPLLAPDKAVIRAFRKFYDLPFYLKLKNFFRYGIWV